MYVANKGKHHGFFSHMGKLEGKEERREKGTTNPGEQDIALFIKLCLSMCPIQTALKFPASYWKWAKKQRTFSFKEKSNS